MFDTISSQIGAIAVVLVAGFAFFKGDDTERISAGVYALAWFAATLVQEDIGFLSAQWTVFAIDVAVLAVFVGLTWKAPRSWPVWAAALQLLIVMGHIATLVELRAELGVFVTVINLASYGVLITIAIGTFWAWQERKAAGLE